VWQIIKQYLQHFVEIVYPKLCLACWRESPLKGREICLNCLTELPITDHFQFQNNIVVKKFWGRAQIEYGAALFFYHKTSKFVDMMHRFKYEGVRRIGHMLGKMAGMRLAKSSWFSKLDIIIPVPIHPVRRAKRGYNQSTEFARGIVEFANLPIVENLLIKSTYTTTQTNKGRTERIDNVEGTFSLTEWKRYTGKHFLLVDDVITTGATIEACARKLLEIPNSKVSVVSIAVARH